MRIGLAICAPVEGIQQRLWDTGVAFAYSGDSYRLKGTKHSHRAVIVGIHRRRRGFSVTAP
jgi:hypothetical protein